MGAVVLAGCPDTQVDAAPGERGSSRMPAARAGESDEQELAHRLGAPDTRHLPVGRAPVPPQSQIAAPDASDRAPRASSPLVEGIAWGDMADFEQRLRRELSAEKMTVYEIALEREPDSRLFVVVPDASTDPRTPTPMLRAEATLRDAWLVYAAPERARPARVRIAFVPPPSGGEPERDAEDESDPKAARIDAAIQRAAEG